MSLIVAARFESWDRAADAAQLLHREGFHDDALHTFYVNSAGAHDRHPVGGDRTNDPDASGAQFGAIAGAAVIGMAGAAIGALIAFSTGQSGIVGIIAAAVGAYLGSLIGAMQIAGRGRKRNVAAKRGNAVPAQDPSMEHAPLRQAGVLLAVQCDPATEATVARILRDSGGMDVERAQGRWAQGAWTDFDPVKAPELTDTINQQPRTTTP